MTKSKELEQYMSNFYGTEKYYETPYGFVLTDGAKAFALKAEAYWFITLVGSIFITKHKNFVDDLVSIKLVVKKQAAYVEFTNSDKTFYTQDIPFTDCPAGEWLFFLTGGALMWHGEY